MIYEYIDRLVNYGLETGLIQKEDEIFARNTILDTLKLEDYEPSQPKGEMGLEEILKNLLDYACEQGLIDNNITARDLFDTRLMACLTPRPSEVIGKFRVLYADSPEAATDYFYKFSRDTDYIRRYRIAKDMKWTVDTEYGTIDITINLSKPEKDPKAIAAAKLAKQSGYPKCLLCPENVGYAGRMNHPARNNHRIIPVEINNTPWGFQYSPYVYYNEHCILFNTQHTPMVIDRSAFVKLFDFIRQFPHYFIGSNADLPIVGGSILSHEHFQGGHYTFAMEKAPVEHEFSLSGFDSVKAGIVKWPMSVIRLSGKNRAELERACDKILVAWRAYSDESVGIYAFTDGVPHNTITPIARRHGDEYECDLVLRNNITSEERPLGIFHPNPSLHHIKKENIGLIEVMGLAVLPARLANEITALSAALVNKTDLSSNENLSGHAEWMTGLYKKYPDVKAEDAEKIIKLEIGAVFEQVLLDAGIYKRDEKGREAFRRFIDSVK